MKSLVILLILFISVASGATSYKIYCNNRGTVIVEEKYMCSIDSCQCQEYAGIGDFVSCTDNLKNGTEGYCGNGPRCCRQIEDKNTCDWSSGRCAYPIYCTNYIANDLCHVSCATGYIITVPNLKVPIICGLGDDVQNRECVDTKIIELKCFNTSANEGVDTSINSNAMSYFGTNVFVCIGVFVCLCLNIFY